ncbi:hypothetical protein ACFSJ3_07145 [Corallincola platygyrae]|uniref:Uncharacterized protein n=1 Tax=Corallincola platygyrae TaxID=1193278 RepID=A0ABW4XMP3_9GAMM
MSKAKRSSFRILNHHLTNCLQRGEEQRQAVIANLLQRKRTNRQ